MKQQKEIRTGKRSKKADRLHQPVGLEQKLLDRAQCRKDGGPGEALNTGPDGSGVQGIDLTDAADLIDGPGDDGEA